MYVILSRIPNVPGIGVGNMDIEEVVVVRDLVKKFGSVEALRGISFSVEKGEVFGLVGPNGAGKTTTLRIIATLLTPTSGEVRVFGFNVVKEPSKVRELLAYLPEEAGCYRNITGIEFLRMVAKLYYKNRRDVEEAVELGIKIANLGDRIYDKIKTYSKGMKRRLQVARVLMVRPKLAVLDEPTAGLDVSQALSVRRLITEFSRNYGITVIMSSHIMSEVEKVCNRIAILNKGTIVECGYLDELKSKYGVTDLEDLFIRVVKS